MLGLQPSIEFTLTCTCICTDKQHDIEYANKEYNLHAMKLCIPVCVSFNSKIPEEFKHDPYVLVGCGGFKSDEMQFTDDSGVNVSHWNQYINEMSMIYWMSKNYEHIGNPDYVGVAHYRRALNYEDWMLQQNAIVCHADAGIESIYQSYCRYHVKTDIDRCIKLLFENFLNIRRSFVIFFNQTITFGRNLFIMPKIKFLQYSEFICKCIDLFTHDEQLTSTLSQRDQYQKRSLGFLLERMTSFWLFNEMTTQSSQLIMSNIRVFDIESPYQRENTNSILNSSLK